jgi:periplasmic divalent cation tolerance protein
LKPVIVLTTVGADFDARPLARELVSRRLAACVNVLPSVTSIYRWEGRVTEDDENLLLIKTVEDRVEELRDALFGLHPYDVPEFVVVDIARIEGAYRQWLLSAVEAEA